MKKCCEFLRKQVMEKINYKNDEVINKRVARITRKFKNLLYFYRKIRKLFEKNISNIYFLSNISKNN